MITVLEIGSNHLGDFGRAKEMICAIAENGGHIAKMQLFKPEQYPHNIPMPEKWIEPLEEYCASKGIGFLLSYFYSSVFSPVMVKIAYSQRHNFRLIKHLEMQGAKLIISGDENTLWPKDCSRLACVPKYPAEKKEYEILLGDPYWRSFYDGISDHTTGIDMAIKLKPHILEKHFKLGDEGEKSPDAGIFAMTPKELKELSICLKK